jgi:hypothetical protein
MHREAELGYDAEIAAPAADRPKQIRLLLSANAPQQAICSGKFHAEQVVDSESETTAEPTHAAA